MTGLQPFEDETTLSRADELVLVGRGWELRGRIGLAERSYRQALEHNGAHAAANEVLGDLLRGRGDFEEAILSYRQALRTDSGRHGSHKGLIDAIVALGGYGDAFSAYGLDGDAGAISEIDGVLACGVIRDERWQLEDFLSHHRECGIERFLLIDNGSTDGTLDLLMTHPDVTVLHANGSFSAANFGSAWFELALRRWRPNGWTLLVDADERFVHPITEESGLRDLTGWLDTQGHRGMAAVMLDMYGSGPVSKTVPVAGMPFVETCPFFDLPFFHRMVPKAGPYRNACVFEGGMRTRVFGTAAPLLSKVPLLRYGPDVVLTGGQHFTNIADDFLSPVRACLLHVKYWADLTARSAREVERKEHYDNAGFYRPIVERLLSEPDLRFFAEGVSQRYEGPVSLVRAGVMSRGGR